MTSPKFHRAALILACTLVLAGCAEGPVRRSYVDPTPADATDPVTVALRNTQSFYAHGEYGNALMTLGQIEEPALSPARKTEYWNLKGLIRLAEKKYDAAVINFKRAGANNAQREHAPYFDFNLATAWYESGKKDEARKILDHLDPSTMGAADHRKVMILREKLGMDVEKAPPPAPVPEMPATPAPLTQMPPTPAAATPDSSPAPAVMFSGQAKDGRIGLLLPLTGKYENFGKKVQRAVELAFQTSTDPRVKGYELVPMDSGETPESAVEGLRKLVEEEQVIAIIGPLLSKTLDAIKSRTEYYQIPLISLAAGQGKSNPFVFSCSVSVKDQVSKVVSYAMAQRGYRKFAVLAPGNLAGQEMAHAFWDEVESRQGEIRAFELYDPELTDFREPVDKTIGLFHSEVRGKELAELADKRTELNIKKKTMKTQQYFNLPPIVDFDAVFIADEARTVGQIIPTFAYRDAKGLPFLGISSWNSNQLLQRAGDQVEGAFFPVAFNTRVPSNDTRRFTEIFKNTLSSNPNELDALAFDAAAVVIGTLSDRPSSRETFLRSLSRVSGISGATGTISIEEQRCRRNLALFGVRKGSFELLQENRN